MTQRPLGDAGEALVAAYLMRQGFTVVARNYRVKQGELDIVALKDELLICVEVKTRSTVYFATSQVVTLSKQKKIVTAAKYFQASQGYLAKAVRFDVALVAYHSEEITYIPNAFYGA